MTIISLAFIPTARIRTSALLGGISAAEGMGIVLFRWRLASIEGSFHEPRGAEAICHAEANMVGYLAGGEGLQCKTETIREVASFIGPRTTQG